MLVFSAQLVMLKNRLLLGSVAFGVGFSLSLLLRFSPALAVGAIAVPAAYAGAAAASIHYRQQRNRFRGSLEALEKYKHRLEFDIERLHATAEQLHFQATATWQQQEALNSEVSRLRAYKYQVETQLHGLLERLQALARQETEINQSLLAIAAEKQQAEANCETLQTICNQLEAKIIERQTNKEALELQLNSLQAAADKMQAQAKELNQNLELLSVQKQNTEARLDFSRLQVTDLSQTGENSQDREMNLPTISLAESISPPIEESIAPEWSELIAKLSPSQLQTLKALASPGNPKLAIKKIAEENITMPELIVDAINEQALHIIRDLIIEPGSTTAPPAISPEYLNSVQQAIASYERLYN